MKKLSYILLFYFSFQLIVADQAKFLLKLNKNIEMNDSDIEDSETENEEDLDEASKKEEKISNSSFALLPELLNIQENSYLALAEKNPLEVYREHSYPPPKTLI